MNELLNKRIESLGQMAAAEGPMSKEMYAILVKNIFSLGLPFNTTVQLLLGATLNALSRFDYLEVTIEVDKYMAEHMGPQIAEAEGAYEGSPLEQGDCLTWVAENVNNLSLVLDKQWNAMCGNAAYRSFVGKGETKLEALLDIFRQVKKAGWSNPK